WQRDGQSIGDKETRTGDAKKAVPKLFRIRPYASREWRCSHGSPEGANKARLVKRVILPVERAVEEDWNGRSQEAVDYQSKRAAGGGLCQALPIKGTVKRCSNRKRQQILFARYRAGQTKPCCNAAQRQVQVRVPPKAQVQEIKGDNG